MTPRNYIGRCAYAIWQQNCKRHVESHPSFLTVTPPRSHHGNYIVKTARVFCTRTPSRSGNTNDTIPSPPPPKKKTTHLSFRHAWVACLWTRHRSHQSSLRHKAAPVRASESAKMLPIDRSRRENSFAAVTWKEKKEQVSVNGSAAQTRRMHTWSGIFFCAEELRPRPRRHRETNRINHRRTCVRPSVTRTNSIYKKRNIKSIGDGAPSASHFDEREIDCRRFSLDIIDSLRVDITIIRCCV